VVVRRVATARLNDIKPFAHLKDVLERMSAGYGQALKSLCCWTARAAVRRSGGERGASETTAEMAAADKITVPSFERRKPAHRRLPEHLPRERVV
jgi:hypothetical protein